MEKKCEYCSNTFTCQRTSRKYCSDNCKQMAYFKRNGFVLSSNSGFVSSLPSVSVKYDNTLLKQHSQPAKKSLKLMTSIPFQDESTALSEENQPKEPERILQYFTVSDRDDNNTLKINESKHANNDNSQNSPPVLADVKSDTVKYKWVNATFLEYVEHYLNDDTIDIGRYLYNAEYIKVLECFKCLTSVLIKLSNRPKVDANFFIKIANTFSLLVQSKTFNSIPTYFPFLSVIHELKDRLIIATQDGEISKVYLSPKRKAFLVSIRFKMGNDIKDLKLNEVLK